MKEFKIRYKNSVLGFVWSLLNPVLFALVFFVAFRHILRLRTENFLVFLLVGLFPWQWFANSIATSPGVFIGNAALIKNVALPRHLLPMAMTANHLIHFVLALLVMTGFLMTQGIYPAVSWLAGIPILILIQFCIITGCSLAIGSLNVFFRDLEHLALLFLNFLFYLTPILYPASSVPERFRPWLHLNPMHAVIPAWHDLLLEGTIRWSRMGIGLVAAAALLGLGYALYRKLEWRFAESI